MDLEGGVHEPGVVFRGGEEPALVVGGDEHGGDDVCVGHAAGGGGDRGKPGDFGQLVLVGGADRLDGGGDVFRAALAAGGVVTDAELVEKRYRPGPGAWLRAFKAVYS